MSYFIEFFCWYVYIS
uniref:Uncharacterized protein n=1 Tax=Arundo donax TaxID=35708 RepID=A0A0A9ECL8_ARUDO